MKKWIVSLLSKGLAASILLSAVPVPVLAAYGKRETPAGEGMPSVVADWKLGEAFAAEGTGIADGSLRMVDQSGNGNDLVMQFYEGKKVTDAVPEEDVLLQNLSFSDETMNGSSDGSMVFDGDSDSGAGVDLVTVDGAPINSDKFENGYTIEFLYKFPVDWTKSDEWMGLMARQTSYTREGDRYTFPVNSMDEPQLGSMSIAVSNCKEVQFLTAPAKDNHQMGSAAWSVSMDKGDEWYHIAVVSDGDVIRTYINGCEAFRNYESADMDGLFADKGDGRFRIGSSWYVEKKGNWGNKELDKFLQGNLQEVRISEGALTQENWLIPNPTDFAGEYGSNDAYTLKSEDNYNFVLIPDTQNTVKFKGAVMDKAVRELVSTADELNVKGVIHLGDVVEDNNDGIQYDTARQVFYQIPDAGIRFLVQPGNHDGWAGGTTNYWNSFGEDSKVFADRTSWYLTNKGYSSYMLVDAGSYTYLVISLACTGSDPGRNNNTSWDSSHEAWLREVLEQYPNCPTIVTTHDVQNCSDTEPSAVKLSANGQKLWNLVRGYDQVFMMVGGHSHGSGLETLINDSGKEVLSILTDYQFAYNGGNGIFRYLEFDESQNKIYYSAYSPYAASLKEEEKSFFDVNFLNGEGNEGSVGLNFAKRFEGMEKKTPPAAQAKWMSGEYHTHTGQSKDATESFMSLSNVLGAAFRDKEILEENQDSATKTDNILSGAGFDFLSIADHLRKSYNGVDGQGNGNYTTPFYVAVQTQQREIEKLQAQGKYADKLIYSAAEWDMPGLDHATVGLMDMDSDAVPYSGIHEFEWKYASAKDGDDPTSMFTGTGNNYSGDFDEEAKWGKRKNQDNPSADVAVEAVEWVKENFPDSYVLPNHPSRHNDGDDEPDYGEVTIETLRRLNDAAPDVVFGMEGMPGNQMDPACELPASDIRAGADEMISVTGGVWDAMLSEGRRFYNFANSDFHFKISSNENYSSGYWASEFSRNYTWVEPGEDGTFSFADVVNGMRSGNSYSVNGELISDLSFTVSDKRGSAGMGSELNTEKGNEILVTVRFRVPETNNYESLYNTNTGIDVDNTPEVDHVDLIAGHVTGKVDETAYNSTENSDAKIVKTFTKEELEQAKGEDGYYTLTYTMEADRDMYFRLRGTSTDEVDRNGDPVSHERSIPDEKPARFDYINDYNYSHLSFYANPIFVSVEDHTHAMILEPDRKADCGNDGNKAYYVCQSCGKWFEDEAGAKEITDKTSVRIPADGIHTYGEWRVTKEPTTMETGRKERECSVCGYQEMADIEKISPERMLLAAIYKVYSSINTTAYTKESTGRLKEAVEKGAEVLKKEDASLEELQEAAEQILMTASSLVLDTSDLETAQAAQKEAKEAREEALQALKKAESLEKKVDFQGRKVTLKSAKSMKAGKLQVKWKKVKGALGYQIRYSVSSKSGRTKTRMLTVKKPKTTAKMLSSLSKGKKYVIRVRAYRKVDGDMVYTGWSSKKTVRVK